MKITEMKSNHGNNDDKNIQPISPLIHPTPGIPPCKTKIPIKIPYLY